MQIRSPNESVVYQWLAPVPGSQYSLGSIQIADSIGGGFPQGQITLSSHIDWIGPSMALQSVLYNTGNGGPSATLSFSSANGITHVTLTPVIDGHFAGIRVLADRATIQDV